MALILTAICIVALCLLTVIWTKHTRDRRELELHSITPEVLHTLLTSEQELLIPKEKDSVVYCTCPSDKTSRVILRRAQGLQFLRIKFLRGGLAGWKAKGYPVERYEKSFHLDTRN